MDEQPFEIRECTSEKCKLRFSTPVGDERRYYCPMCHARTEAVEVFSRHEVVRSKESFQPEIVVVLDNIRSTWNVGAMFRSSDGCGIQHIYLCGITPAPNHSGVLKTSLGAEKNIAWSRHHNGLSLVRSLKNQGFRIWALEGGEEAVPLFSTIEPRDLSNPLAVVVGNELCGVDPGILRECEKIVYLPMSGLKNSLNVAVAFGVAVYLLRFGPILYRTVRS